MKLARTLAAVVTTVALSTSVALAQAKYDPRDPRIQNANRVAAEIYKEWGSKGEKPFFFLGDPTRMAMGTRSRDQVINDAFAAAKKSDPRWTRDQWERYARAVYKDNDELEKLTRGK